MQRKSDGELKIEGWRYREGRRFLWEWKSEEKERLLGMEGWITKGMER